MKSKTIVTACLLVFVAASVVAWAVREFRQSSAGAAASQSTDKVIAYYFHGNVRCPTCNSIEAYAHEAVETGFREQLGAGDVEWRVVNFQTPENDHFREDFNLVAASLVLVAMRDGERADWKLLPETWTLVGEKDAFVKYVQTELESFLAGSAASASAATDDATAQTSASEPGAEQAATPPDAEQVLPLPTDDQAVPLPDAEQVIPVPKGQQAASEAGPTVIAYYFHGNTRCPTCNKIEAYAQEAVATGFGPQMGAGGVEWRVVNYQAPENDHFREDFNLMAASLVLVATRDGKRTNWKLLPDTWLLVDDKLAFLQYVQTELQAFLESSRTKAEQASES